MDVYWSRAGQEAAYLFHGGLPSRLAEPLTHCQWQDLLSVLYLELSLRFCSCGFLLADCGQQQYASGCCAQCCACYVYVGMALSSGVLAYIKAFRQRADSDSIRAHVLGKYNAASLRSAKDILWDGCTGDLARLKLEKKARRSSSTRSQELADLDDILEAFEALDCDNCLPEIVCSAEDLLIMPQLLPLHSIEQVVEEVRSFREEVSSRLETINKCLLQPSAASVVSNSVTTSSISREGTARPSQKQQLDSLDRRSNLILFNVPEEKDLSVVSDVLGAIAGAQITIKDTFRLGKKVTSSQSGSSHSHSSLSGEVPLTSDSSSSTAAHSRPRPILIKLNCPWDRRIILAGKRKLSGIEGMKKYFLQPDLSLDEREKRRAAYLTRKNSGQESDRPSTNV